MATLKGPSRKFFARFASVRKVHIQVEPYLVATQFDVGDRKLELSSAQKKRLSEIAGEVMDDFEERVHDVILDTDKKIQQLADEAAKKGGDAPTKAAAAGEKLAQDTLKSVTSTTSQLEKLLQSKVAAAFKKEKVFKELDTEFKLKVVYKVGKATVSLATNIAETVATPINPKAWYGIAKAVYDAGQVIYDAAKDEQQLRDELFQAISKHTTEQLKLWEQVPEQDSLFEKFQRWRNDTSKKLEAARKRYDVDLGKKLKSVDAASKHLDKARAKLNQELRGLSSKEGLKLGIPAGKKLMEMQKNVSGYAKALAEQQGFADDMAVLVEEMGVAVDRRSFQERCRKLAVEPQEIFSIAKQIYKDATDVQKAIEAIAKAAA